MCVCESVCVREGERLCVCVYVCMRACVSVCVLMGDRLGWCGDGFVSMCVG